ncbi:MAG: M20/M25/M40 family metallo-hydrolase, partial [Verrucomicrobiae bacterium]|nr:M20/M25/M40 family metallo-hydrolase [Verrucomicrobiae bacterium]
MTNEQVTHLLQELVRIPSVNPAGQPGTSHTGEAEIAQFIAEFLHKLGLDVERHDVQPGRPNVLGRFQSQGQRLRITLAPHTDTVSVAGMVIEPFGGEVRDGRLYGRGACDTKGSIAAMLAALARCVRRKEFRTGQLDVDFAALMGEETGSDGAHALCSRGYRSDFAIAGEPTNCRVVHAHKGSLWFRVITRGRSCHGATPELGDNAIAKMATVVHWLQNDYASALQQ